LSDKKREKKSASDVSERLSEAQHHAAQGKAFALCTQPQPYNPIQVHQTQMSFSDDIEWATQHISKWRRVHIGGMGWKKVVGWGIK
jgi:4-hydroxy-L-threonine phosphate dehydrogenase PdxA